MLLDDKWWEKFWESEEGQQLKALGNLEEVDAERILEKVRKRYNQIPEVYLKAFDDDIHTI